MQVHKKKWLKQKWGGGKKGMIEETRYEVIQKWREKG